MIVLKNSGPASFDEIGYEVSIFVIKQLWNAAT
jgi:hypothetical protein